MAADGTMIIIRRQGVAIDRTPRPDRKYLSPTMANRRTGNPIPHTTVAPNHQLRGQYTVPNHHNNILEI